MHKQGKVFQKNSRTFKCSKMFKLPTMVGETFEFNQLREILGEYTGVTTQLQLDAVPHMSMLSIVNYVWFVIT